jgi:hypothetical protein
LYGELDEDVSTGFVKPERDARTSAAHDCEVEITRTAFDAADPVVDQAN